MRLEQQLIQAIKQRRIVVFRYHDHDRTVEPHILGRQKTTGHRQLSGYQIGGVSDSRELPSWRTFDVQGITDLRVTEATFVPPSSYNPTDPHFDLIAARA